MTKEGMKHKKSTSLTVDFIGEFENDNEAMGIVLMDLGCGCK